MATRDHLQRNLFENPTTAAYVGMSRSVVQTPRDHNQNSNYAATISKAQTMMQVTDKNFGRTEQEMARKKMNKQETNLPGFSELKIGEDLSLKLKQRAKEQMARDLRI